MLIGDLRNGIRGVDLEGIIETISEVRNVVLRSGQPARVADATLRDETGTVKLSLWNEMIESVQVGNRVRIGKGYVTTFRGELQLNVGRYGTLEVVE